MTDLFHYDKSKEIPIVLQFDQSEVDFPRIISAGHALVQEHLDNGLSQECTEKLRSFFSLKGEKRTN